MVQPAVEGYRFDPERGRRRLADRLGIAYPESVGAESAPGATRFWFSLPAAAVATYAASASMSRPTAAPSE